MDAAAAAPLKEAENDQQCQGADRRDDDLGYEAAAKADGQSRQQPIADEGADDPERDVGDESEARALDNQAGEPPCDTPTNKIIRRLSADMDITSLKKQFRI